ncbi:MAG: ATP-binding cassette domain-containing protein [Chitinivibrionales bacterium]|nr:ATP-binding cassette domain-containing protein [Chitinivibrionales bacterium]
MNDREAVLQFSHVCFSYGHEEVLCDIDFAIEDHWFVGIVGPNGGGKTTLLRLALGLEKPGSGTVRLLGSTPAENRKHAGYVMQHQQFDERFPISVVDVVLMGLSQGCKIGFFGKHGVKSALDVLDQVGIADLANRQFAQLSGGQRQRVLIAQALVGKPRLLMLDEPTANIDSEGEAAIHELLRRLAGEQTILMVSHNINTVLECATHVLCVNRSAMVNPLSEMHPDILERARGGGIAVLHHELNCGVFNRPGSCRKEDKADSKRNGGAE